MDAISDARMNAAPSTARIAAAVSLVVVLSLQIAAGSMFRYAYLMDASGLPVVGGLLALIVGGERSKEKRKPKTE